jgi:hypothetical protein
MREVSMQYSLRRFWIRLEIYLSENPPPGVLLGCGVTARDEAQALKLIQERIFPDQQLPPVLGIIRDVDVSTLDPKHVIPNMGNHFKCGIWFPLGYE